MWAVKQRSSLLLEQADIETVRNGKLQSQQTDECQSAEMFLSTDMFLSCIIQSQHTCSCRVSFRVNRHVFVIFQSQQTCSCRILAVSRADRLVPVVYHVIYNTVSSVIFFLKKCRVPIYRWWISKDLLFHLQSNQQFAIRHLHFYTSLLPQLQSILPQLRYVIYTSIL